MVFEKSKESKGNGVVGWRIVPMASMTNFSILQANYRLLVHIYMHWGRGNLQLNTNGDSRVCGAKGVCTWWLRMAVPGRNGHVHNFLVWMGP